MWDNISLTRLLEQKQNLYDAYNNYLYNLDVEKCKQSNTLIIYPEITLNKELQQYQKLNLPLKFLQIISQFRLLNNKNPRIILDATLYKLNKDTYCYLCSKSNSFLHMIIECYCFSYKRKSLGLPLKDNCNLDIFHILENPNKKMLNKFISLVKHIIHVYKDLE